MNKAINDLKPSDASAQPFTATTIRQIYKFPQPSPNPVTVSVISFGGGLFGTVSNSGVLTDGDVHAYWTSIGIAQADHPKVVILPIDGTTNAPVSGQNETYENTVDVSMIGGCCPTSKLTILLIISPNDLSEFPALIAKAIAPTTVDGVTYIPSVVSISWGSTEINYDADLLARINTILQDATTNGINFCVSTGDLGSTDGVPGTTNYVGFPASSPYVTACGGTSLICPTLNYDDPTTVETGWSKGGGGSSGTFMKPIWQTNLSGAPGLNRCIPDISLNSDPSTGVDFIIEGKHYIYGGTSVAAPTMAAFYALLNTKSFLLPSLYAAYKSNPLSFHDITVGSNGGYSAAVGFDLVTGFGSVAGNILAPLLLPVVSIPVTGVILDKTSLSVFVGKKANIVATVLPTNATNPAIRWSSSDPTIATVGTAQCSGAMACGCASSCDCGCSEGAVCQCAAENTGVVTGIASGRATITVTTVDGGFTATTAVTINATIPVTGVTLDKTNVSLNVGDKTQLTATVSPPNATNPAVTWSSSSPSVIVSSKGIITAISAGTATITVTTVDGGFEARATVTVSGSIPVISIRFSPSVILLYTYYTYQSNLVLNPPGASAQVTYYSSNPQIASVNASGLVSTYNPGTTTIVATTGRLRASLTVYVVANYQYYASRSIVPPNKVRTYTDTNALYSYRR